MSPAHRERVITENMRLHLESARGVRAEERDDVGYAVERHNGRRHLDCLIA